MSYVKIRGMVVREVATGDFDKILTVITEELGKISVSARGVRRSGNRYSAGTQIFSYCDWVLYKGKNTYILNSCDIVNSFYRIREDMNLLAYSAYMLQLVQDTSYENYPAKDSLTVLIHALSTLLKKNRTPALVIRVFSLKLMQMIGFEPLLSGCCRCGTKEINDIYFSFKHCGFVCEKCKNGLHDTIQIKTGTAKALIYVICANPCDAFGFELSPDVLKNFSEVVDKYIEERLEKKYSKLNFLYEI